MLPRGAADRRLTPTEPPGRVRSSARRGSYSCDPPPRPGSTTATAGHRVRITDRDRRILAFCAEHRFVLAAQVALLEGIGLDAARQRLAALHPRRLPDQRTALLAEPHAYTVTGPAVARPARTCPAAQARSAPLYAHDVGVAWLTAAAHRGLFGELSEVVSERRMRSEDRRDRADAEPHGSPLPRRRRPGRRRRRARLHYPDLTVVSASRPAGRVRARAQLRAHARRERILSAYAGDPRFDAVVYLVATREGAAHAGGVGASCRARGPALRPAVPVVR